MPDPKRKNFRVISKEGDAVTVEDRTREEFGNPCGAITVSKETLKETGMTAEEYAEVLRKALLGE